MKGSAGVEYVKIGLSFGIIATAAGMVSDSFAILPNDTVLTTGKEAIRTIAIPGLLLAVGIAGIDYFINKSFPNLAVNSYDYFQCLWIHLNLFIR